MFKTTVDKNLKTTTTYFAVYVSDTPVTLKQDQGHQAHHDNVNPEQNYNHAKFEIYRFYGVQEEAIGKFVCPV